MTTALVTSLAASDVGRRIRIFCDAPEYYDGVVKDVSLGGKAFITYEDGDEEWIDVGSEHWEWMDDGATQTITNVGGFQIIDSSHRIHLLGDAVVDNLQLTKYSNSPSAATTTRTKTSSNSPKASNTHSPAAGVAKKINAPSITSTSTSTSKFPKKGDRIAIKCPAEPPWPADWYVAVVVSTHPSRLVIYVKWEVGNDEDGLLYNPNWKKLEQPPFVTKWQVRECG